MVVEANLWIVHLLHVRLMVLWHSMQLEIEILLAKLIDNADSLLNNSKFLTEATLKWT